ncbi:MAG: IS200/IS605 family transposase [Bacteroidia bacterium]
MADTFTQLRIQLVFAVKFRQSLIGEDIRERLQMYMTATLQNEGHKVLAIYCMPDHCHILIGLDPQHAISTVVQRLKTASTNWINREKLLTHKFQWQNGYGAFSYSKSQTSQVVRYINNQAQHHKQKSFKEEYLNMLDSLSIDYKPEYLFDFFE